jgi:hypothetical protein
VVVVGGHMWCCVANGCSLKALVRFLHQHPCHFSTWCSLLPPYQHTGVVAVRGAPPVGLVQPGTCP